MGPSKVSRLSSTTLWKSCPQQSVFSQASLFFFLYAWSLGSSNRNGTTLLRQFSLSCRRPHLAPYSSLTWLPRGQATDFLDFQEHPYICTSPCHPFFKSVWMSFSLFLSFATSYTTAILILNAYCFSLVIPTWIYASMDRKSSLSVLFTVVHRPSKTVSGARVMGVTVSIPEGKHQCAGRTCQSAKRSLYRSEDLSSIPRSHVKEAMCHSKHCDPSTWQTEAGRSPWLTSQPV